MNAHSDGNMKSKTVLYEVCLASAVPSGTVAQMRLWRIASRREAGNGHSALDQTCGMGGHPTLHSTIPTTGFGSRPRILPRFVARSRPA